MTIHASTSIPIASLREDARQLLNEFDAADGLATYYTLHHDPKKTTLYVRENAAGDVESFLVRCMTGIDLFRPVVTLRTRGPNGIEPLLAVGLPHGRPVIMVLPQALVERVEEHISLTDKRLNHIMRLEPSRFRPEMNALVVQTQAPDGTPRAEIRRRDKVIGSAGVNWRSPIFAEIYVQVQETHRMRGWGKALVNAIATTLLKQEVTPLYTVQAGNETSRAVAEAVGFVDTGAREVMAQAVWS